MLLHHRFIDIAKEHGDNLAIEDFTTNRKLSYSRALIASILLASIVKKYDRGFIGIMLPTSAGCILAKMGTLMSGRTPVMINYSTGADLNAKYAQKKCGFRTIITSKALLEKIECPYVDGMVYIEDIMESISGIQKVRAAMISKLPIPMIKTIVHGGKEDDVAVILFTSGSEKDPKAVQLSHKNILANVASCSECFAFNSEDVFLSTLPYFHVFGLTVNFWIPIYHGARILTYANPLEYRKICEIARDHKATLLVGTPAFYWGYLRRSEKGDFDSLRVALVGADKCPEPLREAYREKHEQTLYEGYGATECSPVISTNIPGNNRPGSVGKPIPGVHGGKEDDVAVILFTSGSEKDPKAVQLSHKNILANVASCSECFAFNSEDVFLSTLPYFHVFGLTVNFWIPIYHGARILTYANPLEYRKICEIARDHKATLLVGTPAFYWGYLRRSEKGDFESLRVALVGADKCPESLREAYREKHEQTLYEGYGATECSPVISTNIPGNNRPGSVGKPIPGVQVRIEHYETGVECGPGEDGRILVKGGNVMMGYYDDFEQTSLHIRRGWYDTGDMGNLDEDGYLWHVGRIKRFVKIGGEMVSLVKIESVLEKLLPEDAQCCVVEVPDSTKGARIVAVTTEKLDQKPILKQMAEQLPKIAMPKQFLVLEDLPKMGSGKIDFRKLTETVKEMRAEEKNKK